MASAFRFRAGGRDFEHPAYRVHRCASCGLAYKSSRLSDEDLADYYGRLEYETFESDELMPPDVLLVRAAAELPEGSRILDYGCGVGRSLARSSGRHACYGVEPNARAADVARGRGITIIGDAELDSGYVDYFDLIALSDVYEHLSRPVDIVARLRRSLKPGGKLAIVTGLAEGVRPQELISEHWYFRAPGHLHMASHAHLAWLAKAAGMQLAGTTALCHYRPHIVSDNVQRLKSWAYAATHIDPAGHEAKFVRALPLLRRAAMWNNAPVLSCERDHVLATFIKPEK